MVKVSPYFLIKHINFFFLKFHYLEQSHLFYILHIYFLTLLKRVNHLLITIFVGQFMPPTDFQNLDPALQHYIQQMAYSQYLQHHQQKHNSYAQIVSNVSKESNPYVATVSQVPQTVSNTLSDSKNQDEERTVTIVSDKSEVVVKKPLLSLAAYGSGSESETEVTSGEDDKSDERMVTIAKPDYSIPTGEAQIVIDKLALHVSKNGEQFEEILKAKNDPRFQFLNDSHEFNMYYKETLKELRGERSENGKRTQEVKSEDKEDVKEIKKTKKEKKVIG